MAKKSIIELWEATNGRWYFHKKSPNGKITLPSQGYKHKRSAVKAAKRDIPGLPIEEIIQISMEA